MSSSVRPTRPTQTNVVWKRNLVTGAIQGGTRVTTSSEGQQQWKRNLATGAIVGSTRVVQAKQQWKRNLATGALMPVGQRGGVSAVNPQATNQQHAITLGAGDLSVFQKAELELPCPLEQNW